MKQGSEQEAAEDGGPGGGLYGANRLWVPVKSMSYEGQPTSNRDLGGGGGREGRRGNQDHHHQHQQCSTKQEGNPHQTTVAVWPRNNQRRSAEEELVGENYSEAEQE